MKNDLTLIMYKKHSFIVLFLLLKYCSSSAILNIDNIEEKLNKLSENYENIDERFDTVYQTVSDTKDSLTIFIDDAIKSLSDKFEIFKEDISDKLDDKVKREQRGRFVTEADFDMITRKIDKLEYLPQNLTDAVTNTYSDISEDIIKSTISKEEFASFQLSVVRDTSHLRVSFYQLRIKSSKSLSYFSIKRENGLSSNKGDNLVIQKTILPET